MREPIIENSGIDVKVTIYRSELGGNVGGDQRMRVLVKLIENPGLTVKGLSVPSGIPHKTVERIISDLKREGILIRTGNTRSGRWIVKMIVCRRSIDMIIR